MPEILQNLSKQFSVKVESWEDVYILNLMSHLIGLYRYPYACPVTRRNLKQPCQNHPLPQTLLRWLENTSRPISQGRLATFLRYEAFNAQIIVDSQ